MARMRRFVAVGVATREDGEKREAVFFSDDPGDAIREMDKFAAESRIPLSYAGMMLSDHLARDYGFEIEADAYMYLASRGAALGTFLHEREVAIEMNTDLGSPLVETP